MHTIRCVQWLPTDLDTLWDFYLQTKNFAKISPPSYDYEVETSDDRLKQNSTFTIVMIPKKFPLGRFNWMGSISYFKEEAEKRVFIDQQDKGPFAYWKHTHKFLAARKSYASATSGKNIEIGQPGTWVYDTVEYQLPLRALGEWANERFVKKQLQKFFSIRQQKLGEIFL